MNDKEIKVIIAGSRNFNDYAVLSGFCDKLLENKVKDGYKITIISGHARGADLLGERYAKEKGYDLEVYEFDHKYGKGGGIRRNSKMAEVGNALIAFPVGESPGTRHMIKVATKNHLIVREITEEYQKLAKEAYEQLN